MQSVALQQFPLIQILLQAICPGPHNGTPVDPLELLVVFEPEELELDEELLDELGKQIGAEIVHVLFSQHKNTFPKQFGCPELQDGIIFCWQLKFPLLHKQQSVEVPLEDELDEELDDRQIGAEDMHVLF